jgi:hypothetical protein
MFCQQAAGSLFFYTKVFFAAGFHLKIDFKNEDLGAPPQTPQGDAVPLTSFGKNAIFA